MNPYVGFFIGGFAGGILMRSLFPEITGGELFVFAVFLILVSLSVFFYGWRKRVGVFSMVMLGAVLVGSLGLGALRYDISHMNATTPVLEDRLGAQVSLSGVVVDEPDVRETHTKLTLEARELYGVNHIYALDNKILLTVGHYPEYTYGDRIIVQGELQDVVNFTSQEEGGGRAFDYVSYLAKDGIHYQIFYPETEFQHAGEGNGIREKLFALKTLFIKNTTRVIPEPASSLLGGVVVGAKQALGEELLDDFRKTGIIHIVVLSGYNITIVADAIGRAMAYAPRMLGLLLSSSAIIAFALMTGAGATIVRASIMALLVMVARSIGRVHAITNALFIAGFLMLLHNPQILVFDPSFQLSFLATLGLIYFAPYVEKRLSFVNNTFGIRDVIAATLATQLFVLPALLYMMGEISLIAIPVNLLILIFVPATMFFGFATAVAGLFGAVASLPFAYITYAFLAYELKVVELFAQFPFASISIPHFPLWAMLFFYALYMGIIWKTRIPFIQEGR